MLVDFYPLASMPLERVLPRICEELLAEGEKLLVVARPDQIGMIDGQLWSYARDSFLPHGRADRPGADGQPILLSTEAEAANGAANIVIADGVWRDEALTFERSFYLFDNSQLDQARSNWRALKDRPGVECRYWKQDERGGWVKGP